MKVYVLTMTSQLGLFAISEGRTKLACVMLSGAKNLTEGKKGDQPSSSVLGVYSTCEKAEQAYIETAFAKSREFADFYGESYMEKIDVGILITNSSDDSYWTLVRLHESEIG